MKTGRSTLKFRMMVTLACCFIPLGIVITIMFGQSMRMQRNSETNAMQYTAQDIAKTLDNYNYGVYNVSDAFATDERLTEVLERDYTDNPNARRYAIIHTNGSLFESYSRLVQQKKIDAIYIVNRSDVLDFADPNKDVDTLLAHMERLDVANPDKGSNFYMYPLQDNFLTTTFHTDMRTEHVVIGSRRVYSYYKSGYPYVHIFAIPERVLYELYELQAKHIGADVYIVNSNNELISSSNEQAVDRCALPDNVAEAVTGMEGDSAAVQIDGKGYLAVQAACSSTDWRAILLMPLNTLTDSMIQLYWNIILAIVIGAVCSMLLLMFFYHRFMQPMTTLEQAMRRADAGDLRAYVRPQGTAEVAHMMESYNSMLDGLRTSIDQRMEMEHRKQDLEMQVLMSQINPHFLYNTLETIVWKAMEAGRSDIGKMAASLGKLYRLTSTSDLFVPLTKELEHVQMYMNIQNYRYDGKVSYSVESHGVDSGSVEVLKLILQPIVENSLMHGMEGIDHVLHIIVDMERRDGDLVLTVSDDGVGMNEEALEKLRDQIEHGRPKEENKNHRSSGIGLHNISERLKLYAGSRFGLRVFSTPGQGTRVELILPWREIKKTDPEKGRDAGKT